MPVDPEKRNFDAIALRQTAPRLAVLERGVPGRSKPASVLGQKDQTYAGTVGAEGRQQSKTIKLNLG